jgi:hypothetical protein
MSCSTPTRGPGLALGRALGLAALIVLALAVSGRAMAAGELKGKALLAALKSGGYVVYFRHFETGQDYADQVTADVANCWTQRRINAAGFRDAQRIGKFFYDQKIPVGRVVASPFCRTWQSADLAFGRHERIDALKILPSKDYTPEQNAVMKAGLLPYIAVPPADGTNVIVMAHDDNLVAAGGPLLDVQGEAAVLKPDGKDGFTVVARLKPDQWTVLGAK